MKINRHDKMIQYKPRSNLKFLIKRVIALNLLVNTILIGAVPICTYGVEAINQDKESTQIETESNNNNEEDSDITIEIVEDDEDREVRRRVVYGDNNHDTVDELLEMTDYEAKLADSYLASQYTVPFKTTLYSVIMNSSATKDTFSNLYNEDTDAPETMFYRPLYLKENTNVEKYRKAKVEDILKYTSQSSSSFCKFYVDYIDDEGELHYIQVYYTNPYTMYYYTLMSTKYPGIWDAIQQHKDVSLYMDNYGNIVLGGDASGGKDSRAMVIPNIINPCFSKRKLNWLPTRAFMSSLDYDALKIINSSGEQISKSTSELIIGSRLANGILPFTQLTYNGEVKTNKDIYTDLNKNEPYYPIDKTVKIGDKNQAFNNYLSARNEYNGNDNLDNYNIFFTNFGTGFSEHGWNMLSLKWGGGSLQYDSEEALSYLCNEGSTLSMLDNKSLDNSSGLPLKEKSISIWSADKNNNFKKQLAGMTTITVDSTTLSTMESNVNSLGSSLDAVTKSASWGSGEITKADLYFYSTITGMSGSSVPSQFSKNLKEWALHQPYSGLKSESAEPEAIAEVPIAGVAKEEKDKKLSIIIDKIETFLTKTGSSLTQIATSKNSVAYNNIKDDNNTMYLLQISQIYNDESFQWLVKQYYIILVLVNMLYMCYSIFTLYRGDSGAIREFFEGLFKSLAISIVPIAVLILTVALFNVTTNSLFKSTFKYWSLIDLQITAENKVQANTSDSAVEANNLFREMFGNTISNNKSCVYIYGGDVVNKGLYEQFFGIDPSTKRLVNVSGFLDNSVSKSGEDNYSTIGLSKGGYNNLANPENIFVNKDKYKYSDFFYFYDVLRFHLYNYYGESDTEFIESFKSEDGMITTKQKVITMFKDPYFLFGQSYVDYGMSDFKETNELSQGSMRRLKAQDICGLSTLFSSEPVNNIASLKPEIADSEWYLSLYNSKGAQKVTSGILQKSLFDTKLYDGGIIRGSELDLDSDNKDDKLNTLEYRFARVNDKVAKELITMTDFKGYYDESILIVAALRMSQIFNDDMNTHFNPEIRCLPYQFETDTYSMDTVYRSMFLTTTADLNSSTGFFGDLMVNLESNGGTLVQYSVLICAVLASFAGMMTFISLVVFFLLCMIVFMFVYNISRKFFNKAWLSCIALNLSLWFSHIAFLFALKLLCAPKDGILATSPLRTTTTGFQILLLAIILIIKILAICVILFFAFKNAKDLGGQIIADTISSATAKIKGNISSTSNKVKLAGESIKLQGKNIYSKFTGKEIGDATDAANPEKKEPDSGIVESAKIEGERAVKRIYKDYEDESSIVLNSREDSSITSEARSTAESNTLIGDSNNISLENGIINSNGDINDGLGYVEKPEWSDINNNGVDYGNTYTGTNDIMQVSENANSVSNTNNSASNNESNYSDSINTSNSNEISTSSESNSNSSNSNSNSVDDSTSSEISSNRNVDNTKNIESDSSNVDVKSKSSMSDNNTVESAINNAENATNNIHNLNNENSTLSKLDQLINKTINNESSIFNQSNNKSDSKQRNKILNEQTNIQNNTSNSRTDNVVNNNNSKDELDKINQAQSELKDKVVDVALSIDKAINNSDNNAGQLSEAIRRAKDGSYFNDKE